MEKKTLIIGYGNAYCSDDGVALYVINQLRRLLDLQEIEPDEDGLDGLGHDLDSVMLHQLIPEIVPIITDYERVVFVDAHQGVISDEVRLIQVQEEHRFHSITHHMSPGMVMSMAKGMKGIAPAGYLVSVKGENFEFGLGLSDLCKRRAHLAVQKIQNLAGIVPRPETTEGSHILQSQMSERRTAS